MGGSFSKGDLYKQALLTQFDASIMFVFTFEYAAVRCGHLNEYHLRLANV